MKYTEEDHIIEVYRNDYIEELRWRFWNGAWSGFATGALSMLILLGVLGLYI